MVDFQYVNSYGMEGPATHHGAAPGSRGCPWDREQTHQSIRRNMLEEAYEAVGGHR